MEKSDIIFKASFNEFSTSARDSVESSAYWLIRNSELLILIPLIFGLTFISKSLEVFGFGESIIYWFQTL
jgi:hypothetical protein